MIFDDIADADIAFFLAMFVQKGDFFDTEHTVRVAAEKNQNTRQIQARDDVLVVW